MRIYVKTFGCRVNQVESQSLCEQFEAAGHEICSEFDTADVCVLNTCTVTAEGDKDVERTLRLISRRNPAARIFAAGCYAQAHPEKVLKNAPGAEIFGTERKKDIAKILGGAGMSGFGWRTTGHRGHSRAFVKVQDGCAGGCAYCIVPLARPTLSSKPMAEAVDEVCTLVRNGFAEVVLSGINIGNYKCPDTGAELPQLLAALFAIKGDFRIRLSSIEQGNITPGLIDICLRAGDMFCPHFHIPLQHGADKVLAEMGRRYKRSSYAEKAALVRSAWPLAGIYADVIAGYPTETEADFADCASFIERNALSGLHVFRFSPRPKTRAEALKPLPPEVVRHRAEALRSLDARLRSSFADALCGTSQRVLVEEHCAEEGVAQGVCGNFQKVLIKTNSKLSGLVSVRITKSDKQLCHAEPA